MEPPSYLINKLRWQRLYNKEAQLPETESEILHSLMSLSCDLSPENLHCDGELTPAQAKEKYIEIMKAWRYLELKLGRSITENELAKLG